MNNPRQIAVEIVKRFIENNAWVTPLIRSYYKTLKDTRDSELMTELVYGTVKNYIKLCKVANTYLVQSNLNSFNAVQQALILVSIYELLFLSKIPEYATIHSYVEITKKITNTRFSKLLNALLRNIQRNAKKIEFEPHEEFSISKELYNYLSRKLHPEFLKKVLNHSLQTHKVYIRCDSLINNEAISSISASNCGLENVLFPETFLVKNVTALAQCQECENPIFQDLSTQIAQHLIPYVPRGTYLDLTSAPCLKSSYLSKRYPDVFIISNDINLKKLRRAKENFTLQNHFFVCSDAAVKTTFKNTFDVVILDPPCSGLGTLRRKPEIKTRMGVKKIETLKELQRKLLNTAAHLVSRNGYLCYMTCTVNPEENEELIKDFLKHRKDFIIETIKMKGIEFWEKKYGIYIDGSKYDCDFFFFVTLRRVGQ
ncbi:MAG: transcription antitermination factor NusB [bacterium]|nr:transcription antitermination factor NusB [bacterium]